MKAKLKAIAQVTFMMALTAAAAQAQEKVKIGFITDMSIVYADV